LLLRKLTKLSTDAAARPRHADKSLIVDRTSPRAFPLARPTHKMATITCMNIAGAVKHVCSSKCAHRGYVPSTKPVWAKKPHRRCFSPLSVPASDPRFSGPGGSHSRSPSPSRNTHVDKVSFLPVLLPIHSASLKPRAVTRASAGRASVVVVAEDKKAICVLTGSAGVAGTVTFTQSGDGPTKVVASFTGLAAGKHGFHIHEFGDTTNGCMSTGPHFNPNGKKHGSPTDEERHAGDLGNILATADACEWEMEDVQIPLSGPNSIVGRAVVVHELEDDLGKGDSSEIGTQGKTSCTTGNAGARLACGVIGLTPK